MRSKELGKEKRLMGGKPGVVNAYRQKRSVVAVADDDDERV